MPASLNRSLYRMDTYCDPRFRVMNQAAVALRLAVVQSLLQRVQLRKSVRIEVLTRQPTMRRANTSMTKAT